jgi:chemotaxis methyl-accepting protein methylase
MYSLAPNLDAGVASVNLAELLNTGIDAKLFQSAISRLNTSFNIYASTCPAPLIAPDLIVTPEMRRQSELYLPITDIVRIFNRLYRYAVAWPPVLSSTPFYGAMSWADVFVALPRRFQSSPNPARILERLLSDQDLLTEFLFASFLPRRFYGPFGRYPGQAAFIRECLGTRHRSRRRSGNKRLCCLDAACGTGEDSYGLANLLMENGYLPEEIRIESWTLEPLEVWSATHLRFPYDRRAEATLRRNTSRLFDRGYQASIFFRCADLTEIRINQPFSGNGANYLGQFDIILCNGLLGGPIINEREKLVRLVSNLASFLAPGGILMAADSFHGGWKSRFRNIDLKALFMRMGLKSIDAGEGVGGLRL